MSDQPILRDERTVAIENASYRLAYNLLSFGALVIVAWRGFVLGQSLWDLLALIILASALATVYQALHKIFTRRVVGGMVALTVISAIIAIGLVFLVSR